MWVIGGVEVVSFSVRHGVSQVSWPPYLGLRVVSRLSPPLFIARRGSGFLISMPQVEEGVVFPDLTTIYHWPAPLLLLVVKVGCMRSWDGFLLYSSQRRGLGFLMRRWSIIDLPFFFYSLLRRSPPLFIVEENVGFSDLHTSGTSCHMPLTVVSFLLRGSSFFDLHSSSTFYFVPPVIVGFFLQGSGFLTRMPQTHFILCLPLWLRIFFLYRSGFPNSHISITFCHAPPVVVGFFLHRSSFLTHMPQTYFVLCVPLWWVFSYINRVFLTHAPQTYFILCFPSMTDFLLHSLSLFYSYASSIFCLMSLVVIRFLLHGSITLSHSIIKTNVLSEAIPKRHR